GFWPGHPASRGRPPGDWVEPCSGPSRPPSTSRRRCRVSATSDWLVAHPLSRNTGTLPGGVAELAVELDPAAPTPAEEALEEDPDALAGGEEEAAEPPLPGWADVATVPGSLAMGASL